jgi:hypothetical protein
VIALPHEPSGLTKATWTDADFAEMGWHDCRTPATLVFELRSDGFTQYLRQPPHHVPRQFLTPAERGGLSFAERAFSR